jgi:FkbM family methyltransferase
VVCGSADAASADVATDVPLMSAAPRFAWLKVLGAFGVENFRTTSGLGYKFICRPDDLANFPFYHRRAYQIELKLCAAWLQEEDSPVVSDVGANDGFFSTQLAQMLADRAPQIHAFEPAPVTFTKLVQSVQRLGLNDSVHPVPAAVVDVPGPVRISYSEHNSLYAQVSPGGLNPRAGDKLVPVEGTTLDAFYASQGVLPKLVKIDAEGSEVAVLRGAQGLLARPDRPAILFEYNPITLTECGASTHTLVNLLSGYALHYVDDSCGQKIPFGIAIQDATKIDWICNLFAVPPCDSFNRRAASVLSDDSA